MGGMKSGTGDVWGDDDEDEQEEAVQDEESEVGSDGREVDREVGSDGRDVEGEVGSDGRDVESEVGSDGRDVSRGSGRARERASNDPSGESGVPSESPSGSGGAPRSEGGTSGGSTPSVDRQREDDDGAQATKPGSADASDDEGDSGKPYVVRRMLKDKSVQFERDERLTLFVHDDVKAGEQELEAHVQELFGRDIPVFDVREAVYRAALRNRDDVVDELEEMGYTRN